MGERKRIILNELARQMALIKKGWGSGERSQLPAAAMEDDEFDRQAS